MILIGSPGWKDDLAHLNIGGKQNIPNVFVEDWLSVEETIGSNKMYLMVRRTVGPHSKSIVEDTARSRWNQVAKIQVQGKQLNSTQLNSTQHIECKASESLKT
jgi:hypothetical protein